MLFDLWDVKLRSVQPVQWGLTSALDEHHPCGMSLYHFKTDLDPTDLERITLWKASIWGVSQDPSRDVGSSGCSLTVTGSSFMDGKRQVGDVSFSAFEAFTIRL